MFFNADNLVTVITSRVLLYRSSYWKFAFIKRCIENFGKLQKNISEENRYFTVTDVQAWNCIINKSIWIQSSLQYQSPSSISLLFFLILHRRYFLLNIENSTANFFSCLQLKILILNILKMMTNVFCFMLKAPFVLKNFAFLS